ncbi:hypothetical protein EG329_008403 [Mollisiaceae sp. DMI_Dod_QoI]|nr:hypothetical protein EG329_008403 [Helotiales sp. DMI_Dod_QoI]
MTSFWPQQFRTRLNPTTTSTHHSSDFKIAPSTTYPSSIGSWISDMQQGPQTPVLSPSHTPSNFISRAFSTTTGFGQLEKVKNFLRGTNSEAIQFIEKLQTEDSETGMTEDFHDWEHVPNQTIAAPPSGWVVVSKPPASRLPPRLKEFECIRENVGPAKGNWATWDQEQLDSMPVFVPLVGFGAKREMNEHEKEELKAAKEKMESKLGVRL